RYENSHAAKSIAATRISTPVAQLECAETPGGVVVGSTTPPPTSAGDPAGPGSVSHTQTRMAPIASAAQTSAGTTSFTVSRKKPIAVAAAASSGNQLGPGSCSTYCGRPSSGPVTSVSRPPLTEPGR